VSEFTTTITTSNPFFDHPILHSPYQPSARHWELYGSNVEARVEVEFDRTIQSVASSCAMGDLANGS